MEALLLEAAPFLGEILGVSSWVMPQRERAAGRGSLATTVVDTFEGVEALAAEWRALECLPASRTTPFQTHAFHGEWLRRFAGADAAFRVVAVREAGRLVLVMPLSVRHSTFGNIAGWMGEPILQYGDVVCETGADPAGWLDAALGALKDRGDIAALTLRNVRADAGIAPWLGARMALAGPASKAIGVDLSPFSTFADFAAARSSRVGRHATRRAKLAALGGVTFRVVTHGAGARRLVSTAVDWKSRWLESRGLIGQAFSDPRTADCLKALAAAEDSGVVVSSLEAGGTPVAIEIAFRHRGRHCAYLGAYDPDLARLSPGQVQMQDTIEWAIGERSTVYDLMAPADDYKRQLGSLSVGVRDYMLILSPAAIPAAVWSVYGRRTMKAAFSRLPRGLRAAIRARFV